MDDFLFNSKKIDKYSLPGNTIPDSLISEVVINSQGIKIYGFWIESNIKNTKKTILYFHGNKNNIDEYWDRVILLCKLNFNVFIYDFRGFGKSEGTSDETNMKIDAEAVLNYMLTEKKIPVDSTIFYGYSLGNYPAIYLASVNKPLCVIAETPFASANSITQSSIGYDIPPLWLTDGNYDNVLNIKKIKSPFLLMNGDDDEFTRYNDNGRIIFENAPQPKTLLIVKGAGHTNIPSSMGLDNYIGYIGNFINNLLIY